MSKGSDFQDCPCCTSCEGSQWYITPTEVSGQGSPGSEWDFMVYGFRCDLPANLAVDITFETDGSPDLVTYSAASQILNGNTLTFWVMFTKLTHLTGTFTVTARWHYDDGTVHSATAALVLT